MAGERGKSKQQKSNISILNISCCMAKRAGGKYLAGNSFKK
jgi:hypothetical protein